MSMQTQAQAPADSDALPLARKRTGEPVRRQTSARSVQHRRDVSAPDHREIERDSARLTISEGPSSSRASGSPSTSSPSSIR